MYCGDGSSRFFITHSTCYEVRAIILLESLPFFYYLMISVYSFIHYFYIFTFDKERNKTLHWAFVSFMHFYIFVCKTRIPSRYRITGLGRWGPNGCPLHCTLHPSFHGDCCPTKSVKCYVISLVRIGHVPSEFYFPSSKHC